MKTVGERRAAWAMLPRVLWILIVVVSVVVISAWVAGLGVVPVMTAPFAAILR